MMMGHAAVSGSSGGPVGSAAVVVAAASACSAFSVCCVVLMAVVVGVVARGAVSVTGLRGMVLHVGEGSSVNGVVSTVSVVVSPFCIRPYLLLILMIGDPW